MKTQTVRHRLFIILVLLCSGCSSLLFYPEDHFALEPDEFGLEYQDIHLKTRDGLVIHAWFLPARGILKGSVYFLHGNASNVSNHIHSVKWLPEYGYQVLMIDYRGFGKSEGNPSIPEVFNDIEAGFDWLLARTEQKPLFLLGQSIGASLGIYFATTHNTARQHLSGIVSDAAFTGYFQIARDVAGRNWLTWPLQYPLAWLMDYPYNPINVIDRVAPTPLLFFHSVNDAIIPFEHGRQLFEAARPPKRFYATQGKHIHTLHSPQNRKILLDFFDPVDQRSAL